MKEVTQTCPDCGELLKVIVKEGGEIRHYKKTDITGKVKLGPRALWCPNCSMSVPEKEK